MEALGVTASVVQLIDTVHSITKYVRDVKGSRKEREKLEAEWRLLNLLLEDLQAKAREAEQRHLDTSLQTRALVQNHSTLAALQKSVDGLAQQLNPSGLNGQQATHTTSTSTSHIKLFNVKRALLWPSRKRTCLEILGDVERTKSLVSLAIQQDLLSTGWQVKSNTELIPKLGSSITQVNSDLKKLDVDLKSEKRQKIRSWLSPVNFQSIHKDKLSNYHPGTCKDFLDDVKVKQWILGTGSRLWCTGVPGAGKTVAASALIEHVRLKFQSDNHAKVTAVFCNYKMDNSLSVANILAGIWFQMTTFIKLSDEAITLYDTNVEFGTRPSCDDFAKLLQQDLKSCSRVLIVIDALDELPDSSGLSLLRELDRLAGPVNIMVISRLQPGRLLPSSLRNAPLYEISASTTDVGRFVDARIEDDPFLADLVQTMPQLRADIKAEVTKKSGKMFLMAKLLLDSLVRKDSVRSIRQQLGSFPDDLNSVYDDLISRIFGAQNPRRLRAEKLFTWISTATRYLTVAELQIAMSIDANDSSLQSEDLSNLEMIIGSCAGTVVVDSTTQEVRFVHTTFHEFVAKSGSIVNIRAQVEIGSTCLTYLMFSDFKLGNCKSDQDMEERLAQHRFLLYAASNWYKHLRNTALDDTHLASRAGALFADDGYRSSFSQALFLPPSRFEGFSLTYPRSPSALWLAAYCGLGEVCSQLMDQGHVVDHPIPDGSTPICAAARVGSVAVIEQLLHKSVNIDGLGNRTPLLEAANNGHVDTVRFLLSHGASPTRTSADGRTALHAAVRGDHDSVVDLLLQFEPNIRLYSQKSPWTPLHSAAANNSFKSLERLLASNDTVVDPQTFDGETPLHVAVTHQNLESVRLLIRSGANVWMIDRFGRTCLHLAADRDEFEICLSLIQSQGIAEKKPVNSTDHSGQTALHKAASRGVLGISDLLLREGAEPNIVDSYGNSALHLAIKNGHKATVLQLLQNNANTNLKTRNGSTCIQLATGVNRDDIVDILRQYATGDPLHLRSKDKDRNGSKSSLKSHELANIPSPELGITEIWPNWDQHQTMTSATTLTSTTLPNPTQSIARAATTLPKSSPIIPAVPAHVTSPQPQPPFTFRPRGASKRIALELANWERDPPLNCSIHPNPDSPFDWQATLLGPPQSDYAGGVFFLEVNFPDEYPFRPPNIFFTTKIYHTNIHAESGHISYDMFSSSEYPARWRQTPEKRREYIWSAANDQSWNPAVNVRNCFSSIVSLLCAPDGNLESSYPSARLYVTDRKKYHDTAREWTRRYAL